MASCCIPKSYADYLNDNTTCHKPVKECNKCSVFDLLQNYIIPINTDLGANPEHQLIDLKNILNNNIEGNDTNFLVDKSGFYKINYKINFIYTANENYTGSIYFYMIVNNTDKHIIRSVTDPESNPFILENEDTVYLKEGDRISFYFYLDNPNLPPTAPIPPQYVHLVNTIKFELMC